MSHDPEAISPQRMGGKLLVDQVVAHGVRHLFCMPGQR